MSVLVDASVVLRWFVDQPGSAAASTWLDRFERDPALLVAPDLLRFEVHGGLARLQRAREPQWAEQCFDAFDRLGIPTVPTTRDVFDRALALARQVPMGGYDAIYLAQAEALRVPWLTADGRVLRRLKDDRRVRAL